MIHHWILILGAIRFVEIFGNWKVFQVPKDIARDISRCCAEPECAYNAGYCEHWIAVNPMGIQVVWDNDEKTTIRYIFDVHWTWDDFYAARTDAYNLIDTVQHKVGVIFDAPPNIVLPPNMITHSRSAFNKTHDNTEVVVAVVGNNYVRAMLTMVRRLSKKAAEKLELAATLDEARALVHQRLAEAAAPREKAS